MKKLVRGGTKMNLNPAVPPAPGRPRFSHQPG